MDDDVKENLKNTDVWMRFLFIVIFYVIFEVSRVVLFVVVLFQFVATLFTGNTNSRLLGFGNQLSTYIYQIVQYLTYTSSEKPFPFADWPDAGAVKPMKASSPPVKKTAKKKAAKPSSDSESGTED